MVTRSCVYKDCDYYYSLHSTRDRTLFAFPKNAERARIWREHGKVHPKIPAQQLFMCSEHFDPCFFSTSRQRMVLVGEAIPYEYDDKKSMVLREQEQEQEQDREQEQDMVEDILPAPSAPHSSQQNYLINLHDNELSINTVESTTKGRATEVDISVKPTTSKRAKISTIVPSPSESASSDSNPDNAEAIDGSEVSVFNFKGEEYVQMSLAFYLREKREMADRLQEYKKTLRSIRAQVSKLDL
ncbi:hypothetical protein KR018_003694 [Drosophila ironensis]|nr:hypothetical protein KR018_003694 [Drosophila ironensis]